MPSSYCGYCQGAAWHLALQHFLTLQTTMYQQMQQIHFDKLVNQLLLLPSYLRTSLPGKSTRTGQGACL